MSYDLTVYCPGSPTVDQVQLLVSNTRGLHADPDNSNDSGVLVLRGVKRGYSFTVDGPFSVAADDLPEEVAAVLPAAATMFQVLVEGTQEAEIPHGVRFARKLAKACHGVLMDEQTSEVWPQPRVAKASPGSEQKIEDFFVTLHWHLLEEDLPNDFLERYLQIAEKLLPEALPVRFAHHDPLHKRFESEGAEGFVKEYYNDVVNDWGIYYKNTSPLMYGSVHGPQLAWGNPFTKIHVMVAGSAFDDDTLRDRMQSFFLAVAAELGAIYATAQVIGGKDSERWPVINMHPTQWVGFQPYPMWWVWAGPRLRKDIGAFLGPDAIDHSGGLFRAFSDEPCDRHQLEKSLGDANLPWIPEAYSGTYSDEYMKIHPLTVATVIPEVLRNREPMELPSGLRNPPRSE